MIKYGTHVAFLEEGAIRFGFIAAVLERTNEKGQRTEYIVHAPKPSGHPEPTQAQDLTIIEEERIAEMTSWNKDDELLRLAQQSALWLRSKAQSDRILNPPEETDVPFEKLPPEKNDDGSF